MMATTKLGVCITTKDMYGEGKPEKEEDPWECIIFKGELVLEIPKKDWLFNKEGKPLNYELLSGPDIVKLHAELTDVSPLRKDEVHYLLAVQPPGVRLKEYLREDRKKEIMALKVEDVVMFKLDQGYYSASNIIRGKIRYIGPIDENEGIFFGIEIIDDKYHGKGNTNGRPHFQCGANNGVYVAMYKIVQKSTYPGKQNQQVVSTQSKVSESSRQKHTSSPADNTRSRSEATSVATKAKEFVGKVHQKIQGGTDVDPKPTEYKFKRGNRVVLQSIKERPITGTVRWVGPMRLSRDPGSPQVIAVGIETDEKIKVKEEFPDVCLELTGSYGHLFKISSGHSRVYLPEQMVLHADEYALQQQKEKENEYQTKLASVSVEEYRAQKDLLDETIIIDHDKRIGHDKNLDRIPPDAPLADQNEEGLTAATRVPVGGDYRQMEESVYLVNTGQPVNPKRIELERQALKEYKERRDTTIQHKSKESLVAGRDHREIEDSVYLLQTGQPTSDERIEWERKCLNKFKDQQREHHQHEDYQVIEVQIEQTEHLGNGASAIKTKTSQDPSSTPIYSNIPVISEKTGLSPNAPHKFKNSPGIVQRSNHSSTPFEESPYTSLPSQTILSSDPPPQDPIQFAIGSMVYIPAQHGDPLHGVVMWIGTLPEIDGVIAGVELDNPLTGCTDGTWLGRRFFNCPPGKAFFCPINFMKLDKTFITPGQIPEEIQNNAPTIPQINNTDSNCVPQVVSFTMNDLQSLLEEKSRVCEREVPFDEVISMMERAIVKQREQNSWLNTNFDNLSSRYKEIWELFDKEKEKNAQLQTEMSQLLADKKEKEKNMKLMLSKLQEEHHQLQETHQEHLLEHFRLQQTHHQQKQEYQQQLMDHQKLQQETSQQEKELSQLQKVHQNKVEEYSQLQQTYQQKLEDHQQLQQTLEQLQKQLERYLREKDLLQKKITTIESSCKVSFKELAFTKEEVGRGAWGAVRVAIFREQRVAVKQMHELLINKDTHEATLQLLHREINTMAQLRHPNLLQFIGAVLDDPSGNPMIITEIMDTSLRNAYETKQLTPHPTCEPVMLTIIRDVAVGLNYLHCLPDPIIHRDVSSANVLLESKGPHKWKTKISDFGSANKARYAVTQAAGALVYSAPEALKSVVSAKKAQTTKMDVFSYGVLFCEVMTCRFPDEDIFQDMLQQVRSRSPPLYDLIVSCVKEDPSSRPIMKQVIEHLDSYIKQRPK